MKHTIVGVDIAKNVMQMHWVDPDTGEVVNKPIKRAERFSSTLRIGLHASLEWKRAAALNTGLGD